MRPLSGSTEALLGQMALYAGRLKSRPESVFKMVDALYGDFLPVSRLRRSR